MVIRKNDWLNNYRKIMNGENELCDREKTTDAIADAIATVPATAPATAPAPKPKPKSKPKIVSKGGWTLTLYYNITDTEYQDIHIFLIYL